MDKKPVTTLVCGSVPMDNAAEARCGECGAAVWPTIGSLLRAQVERLPLICLDCYAKIPEAIYGGVMHHGNQLPERLAAQFYLEFERIEQLRRHGV